jgi:uncharacterized cupin superfamily protein
MSIHLNTIGRNSYWRKFINHSSIDGNGRTKPYFRKGEHINMSDSSPTPLLLRASDIAAQASTFSHPWNPNSSICGTQISRLVGLKRTGFSLAKLAPGKESFVYHSHQREEEWIYILSGRGMAEIDGQEFEVSAGDFMGFPTPSVAHHLRNPFEQELVYLMGGENLDAEVADFPLLGKRMVRVGGDIQIYDVSDAKPFGSLA